MSHIANQASASLHDVTRCASIDEIEEEQEKLKQSFKEKSKVLSEFKKELKSVEKEEQKSKSKASKSKASKSQASAPISSPGIFTCPKCSKQYKSQKSLEKQTYVIM